MKLKGPRRLLVTVAVILFGLLAESACLYAQLVLELPHKRLRAGETVELFLHGKDARQEIHEVRFNDRPIPFGLVKPEAENEPLRIRIRIPSSIRAGAHQVSVLFSGALSEPVLTGVPEILGLTLEEARRKLEERGLVLDAGAFGARPSDAVVRLVTQQDPVAGTTVRRGTRVAVEIASLTRVPEILGLSLEEARRELEERGLELALDRSTAAAGKAIVEQQDPAAGATVPLGAKIAVVTAIPVPDLVGTRIDLVRPSLLESGFLLRIVIREAANGPFETVLTQQPAAGLPVPPGTAVTVEIESLPDPPAPRWPWTWLVLTGLLTGGLLGQRLRVRRAIRRKSYRVEVHNDLDRLLETATPPAWEGRELRLDIRLLGRLDPGRQTIETDGLLAVEEPGR